MEVPNLRLIEYFVVLAEELNFSRTAKRLHISQSSLSDKIKALEADMGVRLFERSKHRVSLTPAGQMLLQNGPPVLQAAKQAVESARLARTAPGQTLVIATGWGMPIEDPVLSFRKEHPDVKLSFREAGSSEAEHALLTGAADVAFVRCGIAAGPEFERAVVAREKVVVWLPQDHRAAQYDRVPLSALQDKLLIFPRRRATFFHDELLRICHSRGFRPVVEELETQSFQPMIAAVGAGCGITLGIDSVAHAFDGHGAVWRHLTLPEPEIDVIMAWRSDRSNPWVSRFVTSIPRLA